MKKSTIILMSVAVVAVAGLSSISIARWRTGNNALGLVNIARPGTCVEPDGGINEPISSGTVVIKLNGDPNLVPANATFVNDYGPFPADTDPGGPGVPSQTGKIMDNGAQIGNYLIYSDSVFTEDEVQVGLFEFPAVQKGHIFFKEYFCNREDLSDDSQVVVNPPTPTQGIVTPKFITGDTAVHATTRVGDVTYGSSPWTITVNFGSVTHTFTNIAMWARE